jgi:acetolactate synthase small subunit
VNQKCTHCGANIPDQFPYCGACGSKLRAENLHEVSQRVSRLEASANASDQKLVELKTADLIVSRVWKRIGIPVGAISAVVVLIAALYTGREMTSINGVAANVHQKVDSIIQQATTKAEDAKGTAQEAFRTAESTKVKAEALKTTVEHTARDVEMLAANVAQAQSEVSRLQNTSQQLGQSIESLRVNQTTQSVLSAFPILGERIVRARDGRVLDAARKKPNQIYVVVGIDSIKQPPFTAEALAKLENSLQKEGVTIFHSGVALLSGSPNGGYVGIATISGCQPVLAVKPCILYFNPALKDRVGRMQAELRALQNIPDDHVSYGPITGFPKIDQELLSKSGLDIVVILGE